MTSTTSERHRRSQTSKHRRPFTDRCVIVYGDERAPHTRMFPDLAGETVRTPDDPAVDDHPGTDADRANAFEWSSLFAHEIVFTHFHREDHARSRPRNPWFAPRLQPAL